MAIDFGKDDVVLKFIVEQAKKSIHPRGVVLFGSRARGGHSERSDYDVAFVGVRHKELWSRFVIDVEENAPTLCSIDLVDFDVADKLFQNVLVLEGLLLYGEKPTLRD